MLTFEAHELEALMNELGGEPLVGSGFEAEKPEADFEADASGGEE